MKQNTSTLIVKTKWWQPLKKKIRERDGNCCRLCGSNKYLAVAHIYSRKEHPELAKKHGNMVTLCKVCDVRYGDKLTLPWIRKMLKLTYNEKVLIKVGTK